MLRSFHFSLTVKREPKLIDKEQAGRNYELGVKCNLFYFNFVADSRREDRRTEEEFHAKTLRGKDAKCLNH